MKKQILILAALAIVVVQFWGCEEDDRIFGSIKGSGDIVNVDYSFNDFIRIDASYAFELTVKQADSFYIRVRIDDNLVEYLDVFKTGEWLVISMESGHSYNNAHLKAEVHLPDISRLKGSGASAIEMQSFSDMSDFSLDLSGASVFSGIVEAGNCEIQLSGASVINVNGTCTDLYLDASGASVLNLGNFVANTVDINLSGASNATIHVLDHLDVVLSGASVLRYYGDPALGNINISGASSITKL